MSASQSRLRSVNDRIRVAAGARGIDANRLRRSVVFHRLLARLENSGLILKGGYCLEIRLSDSARATKDVDVVGRLALIKNGDDLMNALEAVLAATPLNDGFTFRAVRAQAMRVDVAGAAAWRIRLSAHLDGAFFELVVLDLVAQNAEVVGATERLVVPPPLALDGIGEVTVEAVDVYQHAAEKFHAYSRIYAQERPSSRVKDLVDLVLLIEAGLLTEPGQLHARLKVVYSVRDETSPPASLPSPPGDWANPYAAQAASCLPIPSRPTRHRTWSRVGTPRH